MRTLFIILLLAAGIHPRETLAQQRTKTTQQTKTTQAKASRTTTKSGAQKTGTKASTSKTSTAKTSTAKRTKTASTVTAAAAKEITKEPVVEDGLLSSKDIIGVWQEKTPQMADAWLACLQFYRDGKFAYHRSQYEDLNPFLSVYGRYRIKGNTLYLKVKNRREWRAGDLINPSSGLQPGIFVLDGGKAVTVPQKDTSREIAVAISVCDKTGATPCILFNSDSYFRLSTNPTVYK
ncbi:hypothetical protein F0L74_20490 [Chitinophaga agrisoli]|uniref:Uncharacterized protein n=1 Tax=Chitinophaga agrisoli TaxID=2607653 RepID=A0A5B2VI69_9BACT|nr:hypothetical protein [Chitinophaga agrisoli]KAA2238605.1 hypothetical protein F0L74_20490 [Chitinophaga agrisoli]